MPLRLVTKSASERAELVLLFSRVLASLQHASQQFFAIHSRQLAAK